MANAISLALPQQGLILREKVFLAAIFCLFSLSGAVLYATLGLNYNGVEGLILTKIHPATYLTMIALALVFMTRNDDDLSSSFWLYKPLLVYLFIDLFFALFITLFGKKAIASTIDTHLLTIMTSFMVLQLSPKAKSYGAIIIHSLLTLNGLIAILEMLKGGPFFPFVVDGVAYEWDIRASGLLNHPLENAGVTGAYVMMLLFGGAKNLSPFMRATFVGIQLAALGAFGGRTAFSFALLGCGLFVFYRTYLLIKGEMISIKMLGIALIAGPVVLGLAAQVFFSGIFDVFIDRFTNDSGSANTRLLMFEILQTLNSRDLLLGAESEWLRSLQVTFGTEMGIENPIVKNIVSQGVVITGLLIFALTLFFRFLIQNTGKSGLFPLVYYIFIILAFESIAGKTLILAQFSVMMLLLYSPTRRS